MILLDGLDIHIAISYPFGDKIVCGKDQPRTVAVKEPAGFKYVTCLDCMNDLKFGSRCGVCKLPGLLQDNNLYIGSLVHLDCFPHLTDGAGS